MDQTQKSKVTKFLADKVMSETIYQVLLDTFLKPRKGASVEEKAAAFISVEMLQEAWRELDRYRKEVEQETKPLNQVGM